MAQLEHQPSSSRIPKVISDIIHPFVFTQDAIFAYLTCGNYDFRYDIQKGLRPRRSVRTAMANEINM